MAYPEINDAINWLVDYLQNSSHLQGVDIPNVWDGANFGVYRVIAPALSITEVRVSYLSGRTHTGVIYVHPDPLAANWTSIQQKRFFFNKVLNVTLYALYDGDEEAHEELIQALNNTLLEEAVGTLGNYAVLAAPQPLGGDLPDVALRIQTISTSLQCTFQALIS